jgi:hypothetical protein
MYLLGSSAALAAASEKAAASGRACMWGPILEHLAAQGSIGKSLQVSLTELRIILLFAKQ